MHSIMVRQSIDEILTQAQEHIAELRQVREAFAVGLLEYIDYHTAILRAMAATKMYQLSDGRDADILAGLCADLNKLRVEPRKKRR